MKINSKNFRLRPGESQSTNSQCAGSFVPWAWRGRTRRGNGSFWESSRFSTRPARIPKATIATARQMGVNVKMVTGDQFAIARQGAGRWASPGKGGVALTRNVLTSRMIR